MLLLLDIDRFYTQPIEEEEAKLRSEPYLSKPILELALDIKRFKLEIRQLQQDRERTLKYLLIKSALEIDRCLKVQSALQKHKISAISQIFAEVNSILINEIIDTYRISPKPLGTTHYHFQRFSPLTNPLGQDSPHPGIPPSLFQAIPQTTYKPS